MASRVELQYKLEALLGSENVYFQPPETMKFNYPCVVYELAAKNVPRANDDVYQIHNRYTVTFIGLSADSDLLDRTLHEFQHCTFDKRFISANMYHDVFTIYY